MSDYAFKLLLGTEENKDLLQHFLNGMLQLESPIVDLTLVNPFVPAQFEGDDLTVVDVQARDARGRIFAVEVQNGVRPGLAPRMVYTLTDLYQGQLSEGGDFGTLRPVHALWLLNENLFRVSGPWLRHFKLRDRTGVLFSDHLNLHTVELRRWTRPLGPLAAADEWVYFLREASRWEALPAELHTPELSKAMSTLYRVFEKREDYLKYQARENFLREQRTLDRELLEQRAAMAAKDAMLAEKDAMLKEQRAVLAEQHAVLKGQRAALTEKDAALTEKDAEIEALKAQLRGEPGRR